MPERRLDAGIRVEHGGHLRVRPIVPPGTEIITRRGEENPLPEPDPQLDAALRDAFSDLDLTVLETVAIEPTPDVSVRRSAPQEEVTLRVPADGDAGALVLLEQDGILRWVFPRYTEPPAPETDDTVYYTFDDAPAEEAPPAPAPVARFELRGGDEKTRQAEKVARRLLPTDLVALMHTPVVIDWAMGRVRAYVLRFAGRKGIQGIMHQLEKKIVEGLVALPGGAHAPWQSVTLDTLPTDRPARILLFCHGTFSSTRNSFVGLEGTAFLRAAHARYDAVIGFDHRTLSLDPRQNAEALHRALAPALDALPEPPVIDAICYSRGGLVFRCLAEQLAPHWKWGKAIFVAAPNGGTGLASPANWRRLVNLYTNLGAAGATFAAGSAALPLLAVQSGLGAFVKYLATEVVDAAAVPGIAAMDPAGALVKELNAAQPGPNAPTVFTLASDFDPAQSQSPLLKRLLPILLDEGLTDPLFGTANDLVVDTDSSGLLALGVAASVSWRYAPTDDVYHLNYFTQTATHSHLKTWLAL